MQKSPVCSSLAQEVEAREAGKTYEASDFMDSEVEMKVPVLPSEVQKFIEEKCSSPALCDNCQKSDLDAKHRCSQCRSVYYCSAECQKQHWKSSHKSECKKVVEKKKKHEEMKQFAIKKALKYLNEDIYEPCAICFEVPTHPFTSFDEITMNEDDESDNESFRKGKTNVIPLLGDQLIHCSKEAADQFFSSLKPYGMVLSCGHVFCLPCIIRQHCFQDQNTLVNSSASGAPVTREKLAESKRCPKCRAVPPEGTIFNVAYNNYGPYYGQLSSLDRKACPKLYCFFLKMAIIHYKILEQVIAILPESSHQLTWKLAKYEIFLFSEQYDYLISLCKKEIKEKNYSFSISWNPRDNLQDLFFFLLIEALTGKGEHSLAYNLCQDLDRQAEKQEKALGSAYRSPSDYLCQLKKFLGFCSVEAKDWEFAEDFFPQVVTQDRAYPDAFYNLARIYQGQRKWEEAVVSIKKAIRYESPFDNFHQNKLYEKFDEIAKEAYEDLRSKVKDENKVIETA
jgi:tetratricopeptide (TPR) repeat protein